MESLGRARPGDALVGPDGFTAPSAKMDIHEGGASLVCMSHPQFGDQYSLWRYTKIEPQRSIEWIHNLADKDGNKLVPSAIGMPPDFPEDILNRAEFRDLGDGRTELTVTEFDWTVGQTHIPHLILAELGNIG